MTTLAADSPRRYVPAGTDIDDLPVIAADVIYEGAAVGENGSGYMRPLQAADPFKGFALSKTDNASGSAGDKRVHVRTHGTIRLAVSGAAIDDIGKPVYASDDDTFVLTQGSNSFIGRIVRWESTGVVIVAFDATRGSLGLITALTDSSGGTASGTIAAIGATYDQAEVRNAIASLAAKMNALSGMIA